MTDPLKCDSLERIKSVAKKSSQNWLGGVIAEKMIQLQIKQNYSELFKMIQNGSFKCFLKNPSKLQSFLTVGLSHLDYTLVAKQQAKN